MILVNSRKERELSTNLSLFHLEYRPLPSTHHFDACEYGGSTNYTTTSILDAQLFFLFDFSSRFRPQFTPTEITPTSTTRPLEPITVTYWYCRTTTESDSEEKCCRSIEWSCHFTSSDSASVKSSTNSTSYKDCHRSRERTCWNSN